jgi:hypothetical protein
LTRASTERRSSGSLSPLEHLFLDQGRLIERLFLLFGRIEDLRFSLQHEREFGVAVRPAEERLQRLGCRQIGGVDGEDLLKVPDGAFHVV